MKKSITSFLDFFYPPFSRLMPLETFRYAVCGSANTVFGLLVYFISYHYIFKRDVFHLSFLAFKPHIAALLVSGSISFIIGFVLNKFIVFTGSNLRGRIQIFRYFLSFLFNLVLNFVMLKLLVETLHVEAFLSQLMTTIVVIAVSYLSQKHFTFKVAKVS